MNVNELGYWIVDVDGTVALRKEGGRSPYDWDRVSEDVPNPPVVRLVQSLALAGHGLVFVTGRNEVCRAATVRWLDEHVVADLWRPPIELYMRPDTDEWRYARDNELKHWLYITWIQPHHEVVGVLDDRDQVVRMWRSIGLTCLQVAEGDF